ncbi:hypothetical protein V1511DRAFT_160648 [Dipodascopsis uninucleata]
MTYQFHTFAAPPSSVNSLLHSRAKFDAGRTFDLEDDLEFCPSLLSEEDFQSASTLYSSDRSSTSGSPESSPLQSQLKPSAAAAVIAGGFVGQFSPGRVSAPRTRRAIEIVDPATGMRVASPPLSSPAKVPFGSNVKRVWP